jgi:hypothetical protein
VRLPDQDRHRSDRRRETDDFGSAKASEDERREHKLLPN